MLCTTAWWFDNADIAARPAAESAGSNWMNLQMIQLSISIALLRYNLPARSETAQQHHVLREEYVFQREPEPFPI